MPGIKSHPLNYSALGRTMLIFRTAIVRVSVAAELRFPFHCRKTGCDAIIADVTRCSSTTVPLPYLCVAAWFSARTPWNVLFSFHGALTMTCTYSTCESLAFPPSR